jgi:hypothetical protein
MLLFATPPRVAAQELLLVMTIAGDAIEDKY